MATLTGAEELGHGWTLIEQGVDRLVFEQAAGASGLEVRRVVAFGASENSVRFETWVRSSGGRRVVARIGLLEAQVVGHGFHETGAAPASFPLLGDELFCGIEHVSGEASAGGEGADQVSLVQRPRSEVGEEWTLVAAAVVGWPQAGVGTGLRGAARMREAFLHYLDSVRLKPDRIVLHTDTWWSVPRPLSEARVLNDIEALRRGFFDRTGMFFDTYCVDLGWSHPRSLWRMETDRFPNELRPINERLATLGTRLGLWMSPGSGYPEGLENAWLQAQGYEMLPFGAGLGQVPCFALGTRYQREFKERAVGYARQYGLGHLILDFMPYRCDVATHGHPVGLESRYAIDAGLAEVLEGVRAINPAIALEPMVCGYPPSPWWLLKTPFVLGPAGDDLPYGRGPCPDWLESLITARDIVYRTSQESWLMPTQALETFDITVLSPGEFKNMAVMAIGRGRWFLSTYFKTDLMKPEDWDFLAALVRWARQNKEYLRNAWQFGGRPELREAYGYMFRHPARDLYCVRNPWIEPRTINLPGATNPSEARDVRTIYPRRAAAGRIEPGAPGLSLVLGPYETVFLETVPAAEEPPEVATPPAVAAGVLAGPPRRLADPVSPTTLESRGVRLAWSGTLFLPDGIDSELCILVEGARGVERSACQVMLSGREARVTKVTSDGQFGAATEPSPENWTWFTVPLARSDNTFQIEVAVLQEQAQIGIYLRGALRATNDPPPDDAAPFPTFQAERRSWSQTLQPLEQFR
ncbi:MAG: hypothetical protein FJ399_04975 [Verrucomicrobia bacterium]|nr:hypothetical protein [Verrucomicrobiota bacterium]